MSEKTEKKDTVGAWLLSVALWLALIMFAANQGMQVVAAQRDDHYIVRTTEGVLCAVAVNGARLAMDCFRDEDSE